MYNARKVSDNMKIDGYIAGDNRHRGNAGKCWGDGWIQADEGVDSDKGRTMSDGQTSRSKYGSWRNVRSSHLAW